MIIRHGELVLKQCEKVDGEFKTEKDYIVAHSETGHHHIIAGMCKVYEIHARQFIEVEKETEIVHKKDFDRHKNLSIPAGYYEVIKKKEYDPFLKVIRDVRD